MTREEIIRLLKGVSPQEFVETVMFDRIPQLFADDRMRFVSWKRALGEKLQVDPACITIVGGAAIGASLNPTKNFKAFGDDSDIDVAIVSSHHFNVGWRYLRLNGARRLHVDARTRIAWDAHVQKYIYWGTLATDKLLGVLPFGIEWINAASSMGDLMPTRGHSLNFRIYADYESLRAYQIQSVRSLRDRQLG